MSDLTLLWPVPEPVTLGGRPFMAVCFRLRDLARLEAIAGALVGHPLAGRRGELAAARAAAGGDYLGDSPASRAYAALLRDAIRSAGSWPPALGSPGAEAALGTGPGLVLWLDALLARTNPGFSPAVAARLMPGATAEEWAHLRSTAYADHPADELERLADPAPGRDRPVRWAERVVEVLERYPGYTLESAGDLHLSQWFALRSGGKWSPGRVAGDKGRCRAVGARRRRLMAEPGANGTGH